MSLYSAKKMEIHHIFFPYESKDFSQNCKMEELGNHWEVASFKYAMRSARSFGFFSPGKTIFVPGIYCIKTIKNVVKHNHRYTYSFRSVYFTNIHQEIKWFHEHMKIFPNELWKNTFLTVVMHTMRMWFLEIN